MKTRIPLILAGLAFATWETVDIFWIEVPAAAAAFAAMFLGSTLWFWRRDSVRAAAALLVLFAFEAAVARTLKNVMVLTQVADFTLGIAGIVLAVAVIIGRRRARRASSIRSLRAADAQTAVAGSFRRRSPPAPGSPRAARDWRPATTLSCRSRPRTPAPSPGA